MNNPEDHEMAEHDGTDQFSPSLHYTPVPDKQIRAHLAEIFDAVESMDEAELDELVAEADEVDAERGSRKTVLPDAPLRDFADWIEMIQISDQELGRLVDQIRLTPFDRIPNRIVVPKPTDRLLPSGDLTPADLPLSSIQRSIAEGDAINRKWKTHGAPTAEQILYAEICRQLTTGAAEAEAEAIRAEARRDAAKTLADAQSEIDNMRAAAMKELAEARTEAERIRDRATADAEHTRRRAEAEKRKAEQEISRQKEEVTQLIHSMNATTRTVRRTAEEVLTVLVQDAQWLEQGDNRRQEVTQWILPPDYSDCAVSQLLRAPQPTLYLDPLEPCTQSYLDVQLISLLCLGAELEAVPTQTFWPTWDYGDTAYRIFVRMFTQTLWGTPKEIGASEHLSRPSARRKQITQRQHTYLELLRSERPHRTNAEVIQRWLLSSRFIVRSDQRTAGAELLEVPNPGKFNKALPAPKRTALLAGVHDEAENEPDLIGNEREAVSPHPGSSTPPSIREWTALSADLSKLQDELAKLVALPDQLDVEMRT